MSALRSKVWLSIAVAIAIAAPMAPVSAAPDPKAARFYEDALTRYEKRDLAGAIIQLKNALSLDNKLLPVHVLLGRALLLSGDSAAAEVALTEALRLGVNRAEVVIPLARSVVAQAKLQQLFDNPRFATAGLPGAVQQQLILLRASASADLGDPRSALKSIEEAREINPGLADAWLAEVPIRIRARQMAEAVVAADKALALAPESAEAMYVRGSVQHVLGDIPGAMVWYDRALRAEPTHNEALVSRAGLLLDARRMPDAVKDIAELQRSSPRDPRALYLKSLIAEREGNGAASRKALSELTALLDPVPLEYFRYRPQALILGGLAHYGLNEREKAKPYLEAAVRAQPNSPVSKLLAQIHLAEGNTDRAIEALDTYLRAFPKDTQATLLLASAHLSMNRHQRAAQLMTDALKRGDQPELRTMLGASLVGGGKFADAATEFEAALKADPGQTQAGIALATLYLQSSQAAKAVAVAQAMIKRKPDNAGLYDLLGMAKSRTGDAAGARAAFEAAVKLDPAFSSPQVNLARLDTQAKDFNAAETRLNALLAANEKNVEALGELGLLLARRGRTADAQRWLEKAADHSGPADLQPALQLVDFHLRNARPDLALEATKRLVTKDPEALPVLVAIAQVNLANNDPITARTNLTRAARVANFDAPILVRIALLQIQAGSLPGAAYSLERALNETPGYLPALALMAEVELRQGEAGKAEQRARGLVASYPKLGVGHGLLGDVAMSRGQTPAALDHYRRAHQIEQSSDSLMRVYRAQAAADPAGALQLAEQWVRTHPRDQVVRRAVGDAHARAGRFAVARSTYEALIAAFPEDAESMNNLANVLVQLKDPGALKMAEQAMEKRPNVPLFIGTAGWAAFKAGQTDRALQLLRDARLRDPNNPGTRYFLGAVLASAGRTAEAREELETALRGGRQFAYSKDADALLKTLK